MLWIIHYTMKDTHYANLFFGNDPIENNMLPAEHSSQARVDFFIAMARRIRGTCYMFAAIHQFVVVSDCLLFGPVFQRVSPDINKVSLRPLG